MRAKPSMSNTGLLRSCISIQTLAFDPISSKWIVRRELCGKNVTPERLGRIRKLLKTIPKEAIIWEVVK